MGVPEGSVAFIRVLRVPQKVEVVPQGSVEVLEDGLGACDLVLGGP